MTIHQKLETAKKLAKSPFQSDRDLALKLIVELLETIILDHYEEKGQK